MLDAENKQFKIVNNLPTYNSNEITDENVDQKQEGAADQKQEEVAYQEQEEKVLDFSKQELEEIQEKAEPAYRYANALIDAIDLDKNPDFVKLWEDKYEEIKGDPKHNWESDLWKRTTAFALAWNSIKAKTWEIITDDECTDDIVDKAVRYMMALWDATVAAEKLGGFKSQRSMYEDVARNLSTEQFESSVSVA